MPAATIADLSLAEIGEALKGVGLFFRAGPFTKRIRSNVRSMPRHIREIYGAYPLQNAEAVAEYLLEIRYTNVIRRYLRRQVMARIDQPAPWAPVPEAHAPLMFEMGLNWSLATRNASFMVFHAGVAERDGKVAIIPGLSGQGKSTLSAGLALRGWRYFSDEFALIDLDTREAVPYPRPVSLKNESIEVIRAFAPDAAVTQPMEDTHKGRVAYIPTRADWIERMDERAKPGAIVFPHYEAGGMPNIVRIGPAEAFMLCTASSVNYDRFGGRSFEALTRLIDEVPVYAIHYPDLDHGIALVERALAGEAE